MASDVIVQRQVPAHDFVFVAAMDPEAALAALAGAFGRVAGMSVRRAHSADTRDERRQLDVLPAHIWSIHPQVSARSVASVAGSNVYVSLRISWFWKALIVALLVLFASIIVESGAAPASLLVALGTLLVTGGVVLGLERAQKTVASALTVPSTSGAEAGEGDRSRPRISTAFVFLSCAALVVILRIAILLAPRGYQRYREDRLLHVTFPKGSTREDVRSELGEPDLDLSGPQVTVVPGRSEPECVARAAEAFHYFGPSSSSVYCAVYFDEKGRVLCVDHGTFR